MFSKVCVFGIDKFLTFRNSINAKIGDLVSVQVKTKMARGVVIENSDFEEGEFNEIISYENYSIDEKRLEIAKWISYYYVCHLYEALKLFLPPNSLSIEKTYVKLAKNKLKKMEISLSKSEMEIVEKLKDKNFVKLSRFNSNEIRIIQKLIEKSILIKKNRISKISSSEISEIFRFSKPIRIPRRPNFEQALILSRIKQGNKYLLFGPTGSGKTSMFLWITQEVLKNKKNVIILVPEISLSPHVARIFYEKFGEIVAIYHSSFSASQRTYLWNEIKKGKKRIIIGPRSALFLPVENLGLIIVDEEHDPSYKQDEKRPYYNARDLSVIFSDVFHSTLILSSATPSIETYYNSRVGKYELLKLSKRVEGYIYPKVEIIDLKKIKSSALITNEIIKKIDEHLRSNQSVMIFINRRGFSPVLICSNCGYILKCSHCSMNLVLHRANDTYLECHICGKKYSVPKHCPNCNSIYLRMLGFGIQRIEDTLKRIFPNYEIIRIDRDTVRNRRHLDRMIEKIYENKPKVIIGTQLIIKGFDLKDVKLSIIPNADIGLSIVDFRNYERNLQNFIQFLGRIRTGGLVYIQTYNPQSEIMNFVKSIDYEGFLNMELKNRKEANYPPFSKIAIVESYNKSREKAIKIIEEVCDSLKNTDIEILGPAPAPIEKVKNYYRWRIILRDKNYKKILSVLESISKMNNLKIIMDPYNLQ
jgi:primosomal protein N' (replication factor Y)